MPWYVDVGLLYYRTDLVPRAPRTYDELEQFAREATRAATPGSQGYLWQGRQYEGLVCNVYEAIWGHGGESLAGDRLAARRRAARARRSRTCVGSSSSGRLARVGDLGRRGGDRAASFQEGRAVFMRNWPYAWRAAQAPDSPVRGKVGVAPLPDARRRARARARSAAGSSR